MQDEARPRCRPTATASTTRSSRRSGICGSGNSAWNVDSHLQAVRSNNGNAVAKQTKSVLSGVCGLATRYDAMASNPCRDALRISTKPQRAPRSMSAEDVQALLRWLAGDRGAQIEDLHDLVMFMVATGLRIGEALGVVWSAVDLDQGTVAVRGTVLRVKGGGLILKASPKSAAGERVLKLPTWAVRMLAQRAHRSRPASTAPVFASRHRGGFRDPANTRRALRQAFETAGMHGLTSHSFRKTVATMMDEAGLSSRQAADQLGHAKPSMTADVHYGRRTRATGAAEALEGLIPVSRSR